MGHIEASVERNVDHPVLRLVGKHGETETFRMGIVGYECAQGFCVDIVFGFYFYRPYLVSILQKEVEFDGRVADTKYIGRFNVRSWVSTYKSVKAPLYSVKTRLLTSIVSDDITLFLTNKRRKSTLFLTNARIMAFKPYAKKGRRICACYLK